jgi:hypothetical protein
VAKVKKPKSVKGAAPAAAKPKRAVHKKSAGSRTTKVVTGAKRLAKNPATAEIVAATLVAAAAALRNPKRAQALALEAADDLKQAAKTGVEGGALWQLALDVARRSIDEIGAEKAAGKAAAKTKGKAKAKDKPKKAGKKK